MGKGGKGDVSASNVDKWILTIVYDGGVSKSIQLNKSKKNSAYKLLTKFESYLNKKSPIEKDKYGSLRVRDAIEIVVDYTKVISIDFVPDE